MSFRSLHGEILDTKQGKKEVERNKNTKNKTKSQKKKKKPANKGTKDKA